MSYRSGLNYLKKESGFSLIELMIVIFIIMLIVAFTIPRLTGSERSLKEQTVKMRLVDIASRESIYRLSINRSRYATLDQLIAAILPNGGNLLKAEELQIKGWRFQSVASETFDDKTFGIEAVPTAGNPANYKYCIFEDGELRKSDPDGECTRGSTILPQN
jgi:type II secretory pathway pseudopilin PulG